MKDKQAEVKKILNFKLEVQNNLQRELLRNLIKMNPEFINYFDYYEESMSKSLEKLEDVGEKWEFLNEIREILEVHSLFNDVKF